jgi:autoinducer 2-degrading protein
MMVVIARWLVPVESLNSTLSLLKELQKGSRTEPGNITYDFYQDPQNPEKILIYEEYKNAEAIEAHRMTSHFQEIAIKQIVPKLKERTIQVFEKSS